MDEGLITTNMSDETGAMSDQLILMISSFFFYSTGHARTKVSITAEIRSYKTLSKKNMMKLAPNFDQLMLLMKFVIVVLSIHQTSPTPRK